MDEKQQEFVRAYEELCQRLGCKIVGVPSFTPTNHGTFEMVVQLQVIPVNHVPGLIGV